MAGKPRGVYRKVELTTRLLLALALVLYAGLAGADSIVEDIRYHDNESKWVLGQIASKSISGIVSEQTSFDPVTAHPLQAWSFGKLSQTLTYNTDGTIATSTDGNENTTVLGSWKRGIPQTITFADGSAQSAIVNDQGWITQVTDQNGYTITYGYDLAGRLTRVDYPAGDTVAWNALTRTFTQVASDEYGIPAGHWRQTTTTGTGTKVSYHDALWRPLLVAEYDASDVAGTLRFTGYEYDHEGRVAFASYPSSNSNPDKGIWTSYDPLGRKIAVVQDSERDRLSTTTSYLKDGAGLYTLVRNPRGGETRTWYQMFDQPSYDIPVKMVQPEGVVTTISRDPLGKPTAIVRASTDGAVQATRTYSYNAYQELCRSIEPETGATLMGYDGARNLTWSAAGLPATLACESDGSSAAVSPRRVIRTYDSRNQLRNLVFPDGRGSQIWSYTPDGKVSQIVTQDDGGTAQVVNTYSYNKRRLMTGESVEQTGSPGWMLGYEYNVNAVLAGVRYPSGMYVDYAPNGLGQPTRAGSYATEVAYHPNGGMSRFVYGNGIVHSMQQNLRQLPARSVDGTVVDNTYIYDDNGNVEQIADGVEMARTRTMAYDGLDRLTSTVSTSFGGGGEMVYTYDALDNIRTSRLAGVKDYTYWYDTSNRMSNIIDGSGATIVGLAYDDQGNLSNKNGQVFQFDLGNRLREAVGKERYRYDGWGRRVLSLATSGNIISMYGQDGTLRRQDNDRSANSIEYVYLNGSLVAKVSTSTAPAAPTMSVPAQSQDGSYTVSWSSVSSATSYELQEQANGGAWSNIYAGPSLSRPISGKGGGTYGYRARACKGVACGGWSATGSVVVQYSPSSGPTISAPSLSIDGNYTVSWTVVAGATAYRLEETSNGGSWIELQGSSATSKTFATKADGTYAYRVRGCNSVGCSVLSAVATVKVECVPSGIAIVTAPALSTNGSYTVSWTSVTGASTYRLEQSVASGAWTLAFSGPAVSKAFSQMPDGTYLYRVIACNGSGCGASSAAIGVRVVRPPAGVLVISAPSQSTDGNFSVTWNAIGGATTYRLWESVGGSPWVLQELAGTGVLKSGKVDGSYAYQVAACNDGGCGGQSATATIIVMHRPNVPSLTAPAQSNTGSYSVSWNAVAHATRYVLEESANGGAWAAVQNSAATSLGIAGKGNGSYSYRVAACNQSVCSGYSTAISVSVELPPAVPTGLAARYVVTNQFPPWQVRYFVSWNPVPGATSYEVSGRGSYSGALTSVQINYVGSPQGGSFAVRACKAGVCSAWSAPVVATGG